jgi:hypothetical protein
MKNLETTYTRIERRLGNLKAAVLLILIFSILMGVGTFVESYYGTEFAGRSIYKTWPFMLLQFFMLLSIIFATYLRLPPKKHLYGFYVIHMGLITIGCGSFITFYSGIDGSLTLYPNSPNRYVVLPDDMLEVRNLKTGERILYELPPLAFAKDLNIPHRDFTLRDFYPYSDLQTIWKDAELGEELSAEYFIDNGKITQDFILTLSPETKDFSSQLTLGPLSIHLLPQSTSVCFAHKEEALIYNTIDKSCKGLKELNLKAQPLKSGNSFVVYEFQNILYKFFPEVSPWPFDENFAPIINSPLRMINKKPFKEGRYLFLLGEHVAYYNEGWELHKFENIGDKIILPWMGFELSLRKLEKSQIPVKIPQKSYPIQVNNELIKGTTRHLKLEVDGKPFWIDQNDYLEIKTESKHLKAVLRKKLLELPFELTLERFKMDTDPGTESPASYESFVKLFSDKGSNKHHIFMNNPLKEQGLTFYQASYGKDPETDQYISTLSVNIDPGRWLKYLGSLMLVIGCIWHYGFKKRYFQKAGTV